MRSNVLKTVLVVLAVAFAHTSFAQHLVNWDFSNTTGQENTANATLNHENLETSVLTKGKGVLKTGKVLRTFGGVFTPGQSKEQSLAGQSYLEFSVKAKSGYKVSLQTLKVKLRRNEGGPTSYGWMYSLDGKDFKDIPGAAEIVFEKAVPQGIVQPTIKLSGITELQNVPASTNITFRLYAWGGKTEGGSLSIGKSAQEPGAIALFVAGKVDK